MAGFVCLVAVEISGACYYCCMRYVLNKADCIEMRECYEYYRDDVIDMKHYHLAEMFDCTTVEVREVINGTHPALCDIPIVNRGVGRPKKEPRVKRPVGRPRKNVV